MELWLPPEYASGEKKTTLIYNFKTASPTNWSDSLQI